VKTPAGVGPSPIAAVSHKLANVQFRESIPWLQNMKLALSLPFVAKSPTYSKSSPRPLDVPVLLACLPSILSIVEYIHNPNAKL
jgi:hypothetical protein